MTLLNKIIMDLFGIVYCILSYMALQTDGCCKSIWSIPLLNMHTVTVMTVKVVLDCKIHMCRKSQGQVGSRQYDETST